MDGSTGYDYNSLTYEAGNRPLMPSTSPVHLSDGNICEHADHRNKKYVPIVAGFRCHEHPLVRFQREISRVLNAGGAVY
jgi:hypothetical protein